MPNLHDIERRISSVSSTKQITRTMEMVAAAKIRRAGERVDAATPYSNAMVEMLANVAKRVGGSENALLRKHDEVRNVLVITVVSDRGLAGGFNSNILRMVEKLKKQYAAKGANTSIIACGKKAIGYFTYRGIEPVLKFAGLSADPTIDQAQKVAQFAAEGYENGTYDEVHIVYNHSKNAAEQVQCNEQLLPVDTSAFDAQTDTSAGASSENGSGEQTVPEGDVIFEPGAAAVLDKLLPAYIRTCVYHALIDSAAAEQGARRNAMMSATDNATEMVNTLTRLYNRVRQGAITTEISEIVGGAAALED